MKARALLAACVLAVVAVLFAACPKALFTCKVDADCDAGFSCRSQECLDERCTPACDAGDTCINKFCSSSNCPTGPCAAGLMCDGTGCVSPACINTCVQGEACTSTGQCVLKGCIGKSCPNNYVCQNAQCFDRGCIDAGCPTGTLCAAGICYQTHCADGGGCGINQACFDGGCADPLCFGVVCPTGQVCRNGLCNPPTCNDGIKDGLETDIDCGGAECSPCGVGGKCNGRPDCLTKYCPAKTCAGCTSVANCVQGQLCDVDSGYCQGCNVNSDCSGGQVCNNNLCGPCGGNADCDGGGVCGSNSTCVPCTNTGQCDMGLVCIPDAGGNCQQCTANAQCINGQACIGSHCAPCTNDNQCTPLKCDVNTGICRNCTTYYKDMDNDGYGDPNQPNCQPVKPAGYVLLSGDCDDNDATVHPGVTAYFTTGRPDGSYDYNCSGAAEKDPTYDCAESLVGCESCTTTQCAGTPGYDAGIAACGATGVFCYCAFDDVDAGTDAGTDAGPPACLTLAGTATCAGTCPAGHSEYRTLCVPAQIIGCH